MVQNKLEICFLVCWCILLHIGSTRTEKSPPRIFWRFSEYDKNAAKVLADKDLEKSPALFWEYYDKKAMNRDSVLYGSYERHSPNQWHSYHKFMPETTLNTNGYNKTDVLILGNRIKLSHGPRKRRNVENKNENEYFVYGLPKYAVDRSDKHVKKNENDNPKWTPYSIDRSSNPFQNHMRQRKPKPMYCMMFTIDCFKYPTHECCEPPMVDRIMPIGPYVQPSLAENWMSAVFDFSVEHPEMFTLLKNTIIAAIVISVFVAWGWVGFKLGVVQLPFEKSSRMDDAIERRDYLDLTREIVLGLEDGDGNWMKKLEMYLEENEAYKGVSRFVCCFVEGDYIEDNVPNNEKNNQNNDKNEQNNDKNKQNNVKHQENDNNENDETETIYLENEQSNNINEEINDENEQNNEKEEHTNEEFKELKEENDSNEVEDDEDNYPRLSIPRAFGGQLKCYQAKRKRRPHVRLRTPFECVSDIVYDINVNNKNSSKGQQKPK